MLFETTFFFLSLSRKGRQRYDYFMGSRGIYLNKWTLDFSPKNGIPFVILVWVIFPFLPLHFQNEETMIAIGNALEECTLTGLGPNMVFNIMQVLV